MKKHLALAVLLLLLIACKTKSVSSEFTNANQANITQVDFKVGGMTCTGCENTISKSVTSITGVQECLASYTDSLVNVKFDSTLVDLAAIELKITDAGYEVISHIQ